MAKVAQAGVEWRIEPEPGQGPGPANGRTILEVEDDEQDVRLLQLAFEQQRVPAHLQVARSGCQAMAYLAGEGPYADRHKFPLPVLVLLDLKLPGQGGAEVLTWIRAHPNHRLLTVIILSSSSLPEDVRLCHEKCANCFLVKPASFADLAGIADFIKGWLCYAQFPTAE